MIKTVTENLLRHPHVKATILPDGHVALHLKNDWVYVLTPLGALVWEFADGEHSVDDMFDEISVIKEIQVSSELRQQIEELVGQLRDASLLVSPDFVPEPEIDATISGGGCQNAWHPGVRPQVS